jgi:hypothetical protein
LGVNEETVGKALVDYAKRDWASLNPAATHLPEKKRVTPAQYYQNAQSFFLWETRATQATLNVLCPGKVLLEQPGYYFEQAMLIWNHLIPQIDSLNKGLEDMSLRAPRAAMIAAAWELPACEMMERFEMISGLFLKKGRLFNVNSVVIELFKLTCEQLTAIKSLIKIMGYCPNRPFFPSTMTEEMATSRVQEYKERTPQQIDDIRGSYEKLLEGMEGRHVATIQETLHQWAPWQVKAFNETIMIPFIHPTVKNDLVVFLQVGMTGEQRFTVVQIALENRAKDIEHWCEVVMQNLDALLLSSLLMSDNLSLQTMGYRVDIIGSALLHLPQELLQRCQVLKDNKETLFPVYIKFQQKMGSIIAALNDSSSHVLQARIDLLKEIVLEPGIDCKDDHLAIIQNILWMADQNIQTVQSISQNLFPVGMGLKDRLRLVESLNELTPKQILVLPSKQKKGGAKLGSIQGM